MKRIILCGVLGLISHTGLAQEKNTKGNSLPKKSTKGTAAKPKMPVLPNDTATFTGVHIDEHKVKSFDPMNSKLRNLPVKTPVYQPNVTGTNAPGDGRMGIPVQSGTENERPAHPVVLDSVKAKTNGN